MFLAHVTAAMFQDVNDLSGEEEPAPKAKAKTRETKAKKTEAAKAKAKSSSEKKTGAGDKRNKAKAAASPSKKKPAASLGEPEAEPSKGKGKGKKRPAAAVPAKKGEKKELRVWKYTYPNGCWGFKLNTTKKEVMRVWGNKTVCSCLQCLTPLGLFGTKT